MNHIQFSPYHNRHIRFTYQLPSGFYDEFSGVVLDIIDYDKKNTPTEYLFIPSNNLREWKEADERNDEAAKEKLSTKIDISKITNASIVKFYFTAAAQIQFDNLLVSDKTIIRVKLDELADSISMKIAGQWKISQHDSSNVLKVGDLRVFYILDAHRNLIITSIINRKSIEHILE